MARLRAFIDILQLETTLDAARAIGERIRCAAFATLTE